MGTAKEADRFRLMFLKVQYRVSVSQEHVLLLSVYVDKGQWLPPGEC
jgi:hypothetical protein